MSYYYLNLFNYKYQLKFRLAMNNVYFLCLHQHNVILLSEGGWVLITEGEGVCIRKIPYSRARALGLAFRPSARASKGVLHTRGGKMPKN